MIRRCKVNPHIYTWTESGRDQKPQRYQRKVGEVLVRVVPVRRPNGQVVNLCQALTKRYISAVGGARRNPKWKRER
jgi:hypothetical protein